MSWNVVRLGPRRPAPEPPEGSIPVRPPPPLPAADERNRFADLLPLTTAVGSAGIFFMPGVHRIMYVLGGVMLVSSLALTATSLFNRRGGERAALRQARRDHLRHLSRVRGEADRAAGLQRAALTWAHPPPDTLWALSTGDRGLWERRRADPDFAQVRIGVGTQQPLVPLVPEPGPPRERLDPLCADAMHRLLETRSVVADLPVAVSLRGFSHVVVRGPADDVRALARALIAQLAAFHAPGDVRVAVAAGPAGAGHWEWVKWLPHARHPRLADAAGPVRLIAADAEGLRGLLAADLADRPRFSPGAAPDFPHLVLFLDDAGPGAPTGPGGAQGVTVVELLPGDGPAPSEHAAGGRRLTVNLGAGTMTLRPDGLDACTGVPDRLGPHAAEAFARVLAPLRPEDDQAGDPMLAAPDPAALLRLPRPRGGAPDAPGGDDRPPRGEGLEPDWRARPAGDRLRIPIGVGEHGMPVHLDLKEAALDGMGPHGLCVGATGSGKSELLRTLVLGLALTHDPASLNMVLADFKGGATFAGLAPLPHVSAVITNLADDLAMVDRMRDALTGELTRRQEVLRAGGNHAGVHEYERARAAGAPLPRLPSLLIVIDEFSELLTARPDFIETFLQIGRIGRSLGVHLLLASQRLEEGRLRGLDTYLSYRIALRTFSAAESRAVIGVPDAFHLPAVPGSGLLTHGNEPPVRFSAAYVSGPWRRDDGRRRPAPGPARGVIPFTARATGPIPQREAAPAVRADEETFAQAVVRSLAGRGPAAHPVWLPPLREPPTLDGLVARRPPHPPLVVPLGVVDRPREQRRDTLLADLGGAAGHVLVVGGPRSGKSTLLRTLVSAFALTHPPSVAQFYCLDLTGGGLGTLASLPNVGAVAGRPEGERVRRVVARVHAALDRREALFRDAGIDSVAAFRAAVSRGEHPDGDLGDVFLVVDGWATLRGDFEALEPRILDIAARGLGFGVHVVVSAGRWADVRAALKDHVGTRLELRLGEPGESEVDRRAAGQVPPGSPGRGVTRDGAHFLTALPRVDGVPGVADLAAAAPAVAARARRAWPGEQAPSVPVLPRLFTADRLPPPSPADSGGTGLRVPIGLDEEDLAPVFVDLDADPHFVAYGAAGSGRTNLLRLIARGVCARRGPARARVIVADVRRTLLGAVPDTHLLAYAASAPALAAHVGEAAGSFSRRLPGPEVTADQLRDRSWWNGPDLFLVVDDYDLLATGPGGGPLAPLLEFLPLSRDIGLHLLLARNSGGAGRAQFEPVLQRLRELGTQGLVLDGQREEGPLVGDIRPGPQPPGRGHLVSRRHGVRLVQTGWDDP